MANIVKKYKVRSESTPGVTYTVSLRENGKFACSCPAWIFSGKKRTDCKHIRRTQVRRNAAGAR